MAISDKHRKNFSHPAEGVHRGIGYRRKGGQKTRIMGLPDSQKRFKIGLAV